MKLATPGHYPKAWYPLCCSSELKKKPLKIKVFGVYWVLFRAAGGRPAAVYAFCSHLGADLSRGDVVNGRLRCHFHHWEYGCSGRCESIPACETPPKRARQYAMVCEERYGLVFGFLGSEPLYPLPAPDFEPGSYSAPTMIEAQAPYQTVGANIFDMQHLFVVHQRKLKGEPEVSDSDPFMMRISYRAGVMGEHAYDRILKMLGLDEVTIEIESWGGNCFLCFFREIGHLTLMVVQPIDATHSRLFLVTLRDAEKDRGVLWRRLVGEVLVRLHHRMNIQFIAPDVRSVEGSLLDIQTLLPEADRVLARWIKHYRAMPTEDVSHLVIS